MKDIYICLMCVISISSNALLRADEPFSPSGEKAFFLQPATVSGTLSRFGVRLMRDQVILVESFGAYIIIRFTFIEGTKTAYSLRQISKKSGDEKKVDGVLFENYERVKRSDGSYNIKDMGSSLLFDTIGVAIEWSYGGENFGWIYLNLEHIRFVVLPKRFFEIDTQLLVNQTK